MTFPLFDSRVFFRSIKHLKSCFWSYLWQRPPSPLSRVASPHGKLFVVSLSPHAFHPSFSSLLVGCDCDFHTLVFLLFEPSPFFWSIEKVPVLCLPPSTICYSWVRSLPISSPLLHDCWLSWILPSGKCRIRPHFSLYGIHSYSSSPLLLVSDNDFGFTLDSPPML